MKIIVGLALSLVVLSFCINLFVKSIKHKKVGAAIVSFLIILFYLVCFYISEFLLISLEILVIPQIIFLFYVLSFFGISMLKSKKVNTKKEECSKDFQPYISVVVAVHNEELVVEKSIKNLLSLNYDPNLFDITFIDDFSTDNTPKILQKYRDQINFIDRSIDSRPDVVRGKPAAINEYYKKLNGDLLCVFDADSLPEKDFLLKVVKHFKDDNIGVVQGRNVFYNESKNFITRLTALDLYSLQYSMYKPMNYSGFGMFEGRAGIFRKEVFERVGGFDPTLPAEDYDFSCRVAIEGYKIVYDMNVYSREQVTETLLEWFKQRKRWLASHVLAYLKNVKSLYTTNNLNANKKLSMTFILSNLLFFFFFNFYGPLILMNEYFYTNDVSYVFIISFISIVSFFCLPYIIQTKRFHLIFLIPVMIIYYWVFTIIETWVFINEKILGIKLFYKKALHRKPLLDEI